MLGSLLGVLCLGVASVISFQFSLSYAQIDISGATNLKPEEKASAQTSGNRLQANITQSPPQPERTNADIIVSDIMAQAEVSKKTPDKAYLLIY